MALSQAQQYERDRLLETYQRCKEKHPKGCYGMWTWNKGTLKVQCQGCGYTMKIDVRTRKLRHLSTKEALKNHIDFKHYDFEG